MPPSLKDTVSVEEMRVVKYISTMSLQHLVNNEMNLAIC